LAQYAPKGINASFTKESGIGRSDKKGVITILKIIRASAVVIALAALLSLLVSCTEAELPNTSTEEVRTSDISPSPIPSTDELPSFSSDGSVPSVPETDPPKDPKDDAPYNVSEVRSLLTGLPTDITNTLKRPVAIMINNERKCLPQVGISNASILYECNIEGGVNRLIGIFEDYESLDYVGPVRSCRPYFLDIAQMHDAIYVHAGGSAEAYNQLRSRGINNIDGVNEYRIEILFWRDPIKYKERGYEHSLMINGQGIKKAIAYKKYRTDLNEGFSSTYRFKDSPSDISDAYKPSAANYIYIPHSSYIESIFEYHKDDMRYYRFQHNRAHIDETTGEQLSFDNVVVIFTPRKIVDDYGRLDVDITGEGEGYYASRGEYIPIKWTRANKDTVINYYHADGTPLMLNPGKTFVSVASTGIKHKVDMNKI